MPLADLPQSNKQHAVPQNIMDVEFKLIGDLTMRQFSYLLACGILSYLSFVAVVGIFRFPLGVIFALLGLGLAFLPLGERGLDDWIASFIRAINSPTQRVWKKEPEIPIAFSYQSIDVMKQELITLAPTSSRRRLEQYLKNQVEGEGVDPLDIPEREYIMKVREAFAYSRPSEPVAQGGGISAPVGVSVIEEPEVSTPEPPKKEEQPAKPIERIEPEKPPVTETKMSPPAQKQAVPSVPSVPPVKAGEPVVQVPVRVETPAQVIVKPKPTPVPQAAPAKAPAHLLREGNLAPRQDSGMGMPSITPDMHSGRKFMNLLPSSGELILPIRGERVLKTSDQMVVEEDLKEKTEKLQQLLAHIREKEGLHQQQTQQQQVQRAESKPQPQQPQTQFQQQPKPQAPQPHQEPQPKPAAVEKAPVDDHQKKFEEHTEKMASGYSDLGKKYQQLQTELEEMKKAGIVAGAAELSYSPVAMKRSLSQTPDILSGIVKDSTGKMLPDILIIVKDQKGEAIRAVKTNPMGEFLLLTPLDKGVYTVEVSQSNNLSETFAIIPIEIRGEVVPLVELEGKQNG